MDKIIIQNEAHYKELKNQADALGFQFKFSEKIPFAIRIDFTKKIIKNQLRATYPHPCGPMPFHPSDNLIKELKEKVRRRKKNNRKRILIKPIHLYKLSNRKIIINANCI